MTQTRRDFLRGTIGWGGLLMAGSLRLAATHETEPLRRARHFLATQQSAEGAWRSHRYAAFREGDVLTPVVLWAMLPRQKAPAGDEVFARGLRWLCELTDACRKQQEPWTSLHYPLFTASYASQVLAQVGDTDRAAVWAKIIEALRTSEALGWPSGDPMCGAWSDAATPPRYLAPVPDMLATNISATALALRALSATGRGASGITALTFIQHCQNFAEDQPGAFDDGGFFFALDDPIRNKAGSAGRDETGRERYRSYGSATCDGILALRDGGYSHDHPRMRAAMDWLRRNSDGLKHSGAWSESRAEARASLAFYHAQALAAVLADLPVRAAWSGKLGESVRSALYVAQNADGGWQGLAPDSCEDEPLLASAFALRALHLLA